MIVNCYPAQSLSNLQKRSLLPVLHSTSEQYFMLLLKTRLTMSCHSGGSLECKLANMKTPCTTTSSYLIFRGPTYVFALYSYIPDRMKYTILDIAFHQNSHTWKVFTLHRISFMKFYHIHLPSLYNSLLVEEMYDHQK